MDNKEAVSWLMGCFTLMLEYLEHHAAALTCLFLILTFIFGTIFKFVKVRSDRKLNEAMITAIKKGDWNGKKITERSDS